MIKQNESELGDDMIIVSRVVFHFIIMYNVNVKTRYLSEAHDIWFRSNYRVVYTLIL